MFKKNYKLILLAIFLIICTLVKEGAEAVGKQMVKNVVNQGVKTTANHLANDSVKTTANHLANDIGKKITNLPNQTGTPATSGISQFLPNKLTASTTSQVSSVPKIPKLPEPSMGTDISKISFDDSTDIDVSKISFDDSTDIDISKKLPEASTAIEISKTPFPKLFYIQVGRTKVYLTNQNCLKDFENWGDLGNHYILVMEGPGAMDIINTGVNFGLLINTLETMDPTSMCYLGLATSKGDIEAIAKHAGFLAENHEDLCKIIPLLCDTLNLKRERFVTPENVKDMRLFTYLGHLGRLIRAHTDKRRLYLKADSVEDFYEYAFLRMDEYKTLIRDCEFARQNVAIDNHFKNLTNDKLNELIKLHPKLSTYISDAQKIRDLKDNPFSSPLVIKQLEQALEKKKNIIEPELIPLATAYKVAKDNLKQAHGISEKEHGISPIKPLLDWLQ